MPKFGATFPNGSVQTRTGDRKKAATERVKREMYFAAGEKHRRCIRAAKSKEKFIDVRPAENVPLAQSNVAARVGQETLAVVIEDRVVPLSQRSAFEWLSDLRSVRVIGDEQSNARLGKGVGGAVK